MSDKKWLLHLSDIHFNRKEKSDYDPHDLDFDLRDQLEADVQRLLKSTGRIDGIIVSGDVAFAGREPEYEAAGEWLSKLCNDSGCERGAVWCVPGNHDVDRSVYEGSRLLQALHKEVRGTDPGSIDDWFGRTLRDKEAASVLLRPFEKYNRYFGERYKCPTHPGSLFWEDRLLLNDSSTLLLRGVNSAVISDAADDNRDYRLALGTHQATPLQRANEAVDFICHHPPDWMVDYDQVIPVVNSRARVQLFGHKHSQAAYKTDNSLIVVAGAVHPDRREPKWRPRYNLIGFSVEAESNVRKLVVDHYPRVWGETEPKFGADFNRCEGAEFKSYRLDLEWWERPADAGMAGPSVQATTPAPTRPKKTLPVGEQDMDPAKVLTYRFLSLPHLVRLRIAQQMSLLNEQDEGLLDAELLGRMMERATAQGKLAELWRRVIKESGERPRGPNPYSGR